MSAAPFAREKSKILLNTTGGGRCLALVLCKASASCLEEVADDGQAKESRRDLGSASLEHAAGDIGRVGGLGGVKAGGDSRAVCSGVSEREDGVGDNLGDAVRDGRAVPVGREAFRDVGPAAVAVGLSAVVGCKCFAGAWDVFTGLGGGAERAPWEVVGTEEEHADGDELELWVGSLGLEVPVVAELGLRWNLSAGRRECQKPSLDGESSQYSR